MNNKAERLANDRFEEMDQDETDQYFIENFMSDDNDAMEWLEKFDFYICEKSYYFLQKYHEGALKDLIEHAVQKNDSLVNESVFRNLMEFYSYAD